MTKRKRRPEPEESEGSRTEELSEFEGDGEGSEHELKAQDYEASLSPFSGSPEATLESFGDEAGKKVTWREKKLIREISIRSTRKKKAGGKLPKRPTETPINYRYIHKMVSEGKSRTVKHYLQVIHRRQNRIDRALSRRNQLGLTPLESALEDKTSAAIVFLAQNISTSTAMAALSGFPLKVLLAKLSAQIEEKHCTRGHVSKKLETLLSIDIGSDYFSEANLKEITKNSKARRQLRNIIALLKEVKLKVVAYRKAAGPKLAAFLEDASTPPLATPPEEDAFSEDQDTPPLATPSTDTVTPEEKAISHAPSDSPFTPEYMLQMARSGKMRALEGLLSFAYRGARVEELILLYSNELITNLLKEPSPNLLTFINGRTSATTKALLLEKFDLKQFWESLTCLDSKKITSDKNIIIEKFKTLSIVVGKRIRPSIGELAATTSDKNKTKSDMLLSYLNEAVPPDSSASLFARRAPTRRQLRRMATRYGSSSSSSSSSRPT